jgi:hypothetical protein
MPNHQHHHLLHRDPTAAQSQNQHQSLLLHLANALDALAILSDDVCAKRLFCSSHTRLNRYQRKMMGSEQNNEWYVIGYKRLIRRHASDAS